MKRFAAGLAGLALVLGSFVAPLMGVARAAGTNLINNPSAETATATLPSGWNKGGWGTNTATFSYDATGAQDGAKALGLTVSSYTNGDAKWYFNPVAVTAGTKYVFSDYYQASVATQVDAQIEDATGKLSYLWLGDIAASSTWKQFSVEFTAPAGAKNVTIFHTIAKAGTLKTDNFSLIAVVAPTPTPTPTPSATPTPTPSPTPTPTPTPTPSAGVPNSSLETANGTTPQDWRADSWGNNTAAFSYLATGHTGSKSVKVDVTNYVDGSANWSYAPQPVTAGGHYLFSDWYQATVDTEVDAGVTMSDGTVHYFYLGKIPASTTWKQAKLEFDVPAGAVSATIFHLIAAKGSLTTDDYSFGLYTPAAFKRGLVTVTFDDGWTNQYTNALPIMKKYGLTSTFYIISGELTSQPDYMTVAQIKALKTAGAEIGSHSVSHVDFTTLTATQLTNQFKNSQATLANKFGAGTITSFAYPYGAYNAKTQVEGAKYYQTQRSTESGYNTKDNLNLQNLKVQNIFSTTTPAQVQAWINQAKLQGTWLILVYHEIALVPTDPTDGDYTTKPADLDTEMAAVKASGLGVVTISQGVKEVLPQIGK